jgi:hypothetical protein
MSGQLFVDYISYLHQVTRKAPQHVCFARKVYTRSLSCSEAPGVLSLSSSESAYELGGEEEALSGLLLYPIQ